MEKYENNSRLIEENEDGFFIGATKDVVDSIKILEKQDKLLVKSAPKFYNESGQGFGHKELNKKPNLFFNKSKEAPSVAKFNQNYIVKKPSFKKQESLRSQGSSSDDFIIETLGDFGNSKLKNIEVKDTASFFNSIDGEVNGIDVGKTFISAAEKQNEKIDTKEETKSVDSKKVDKIYDKEEKKSSVRDSSSSSSSMGSSSSSSSKLSGSSSSSSSSSVRSKIKNNKLIIGYLSDNGSEYRKELE